MLDFLANGDGPASGRDLDGEAVLGLGEADLGEGASPLDFLGLCGERDRLRLRLRAPTAELGGRGRCVGLPLGALSFVLLEDPEATCGDLLGDADLPGCGALADC